MEPEPASLMKRIRIDAHAAWLAARDPRCPWYARAFGLLVTAYALSPIDLIPDFIPVLGLLDEALLLPAAILLVLRLIPPEVMAEHRAAAARFGERPTSPLGAALVIAVWAASAAALLWVFWPRSAG